MPNFSSVRTKEFKFVSGELTGLVLNPAGLKIFLKKKKCFSYFLVKHDFYRVSRNFSTQWVYSTIPSSTTDIADNEKIMSRKNYCRKSIKLVYECCISGRKDCEIVQILIKASNMCLTICILSQLFTPIIQPPCNGHVLSGFYCN